MAGKSSYTAEEKGAEIEEALDSLDKLVDRLKVLYEQYFMGIQKQAPSHLHTDAERRIREVTQLQIRNTALRYRFVTIQQKYGAYNAYWKRSLREIEAGRYVRNLSKIKRQAAASGADIAPEILAAMPKRMRDAIERDRAQAIADAERHGKLGRDTACAPAAESDELDTQPVVARIVAPPPPARRDAKVTTDPFANASDDDIGAALSGLAEEALAALDRPAAPRPAARPPLPPLTARPPLPPLTARPPPPPLTARPPPPPPSKAPPPIPTMKPQVPGMTEGETRALYAKYVKAREVVGDKTEGLTYERLVRTLSTQAPKILEQHQAKGIEFNVVIRDNKVVLKAKPR